ncbi:MAG TPA: MFS transporter [Burkholderiaceae bacterium]|nr:MFS transporter [Burkholderiaceae bacterium]
MRLAPSSVISRDELVAGMRALVRDAAWVSLTGALSGGVVLVAFALHLGAGPLEIGLLGAIPFIAQAAQLPAIMLVERVRQRKRIGVNVVLLARLLILLLALLPFVPSTHSPVALLIGAQAMISTLGSIGACAINSWFHQLLLSEALGTFFAKRLLVATVLGGAATLAVGWLVDHPPWGDPIHAYAIAFAVAGVAGFVSAFYLARCPEPRMEDAGPPATLRDKLRAPLSDPNFRGLLVLLGAWNLASNIVAPFLTVYLMQQLNYGLSTVTLLWVASQSANALTLYLWGRLSDRLSNKAILAVALPVYFACTLGLVFARSGETYGLQLPLLYLVHVLMGAASGGIGLATGNLGLKLAPRGQGTPYLAAVGLASAVAGGVAPLLGGAIARWFTESRLSVVARWESPYRVGEVSVLAFAHWEFLFALSALLGLYVMHALSRIREGDEISERVVIQEFGLEALRTVNQLSSIGGALGGLFTFGRLSERRMRPTPGGARERRRTPRPSAASRDAP